MGNCAWRTVEKVMDAESLIEKLEALLPDERQAVYGYDVGGGKYAGGVTDAIDIIRQHKVGQAENARGQMAEPQNSTGTTSAQPELTVRQKKSWVDFGSGSLPSE
jgi:hypothetical protein